MLAENSPTVQGDANGFTWWCTHKIKTNDAIPD